MTTSIVDVYNWALAALGSRSRVQSPTESSIEAERCSLFFENVRDQILRSAPWDCARSYKRLAVSAVRDETQPWTDLDPPPGYRFAYSLPADFIWPRYLTTFAKFELGINANNQRVLYTNQEQAILCYTKRQTRIDLWEADLAAAIGFALAAHICASITGSNDKVRLVTSQAIDKILTARQNSANAPQILLETTPEWIAARGSAYGINNPIFIYPSAEFAYGGLSLAAG